MKKIALALAALALPLSVLATNDANADVAKFGPAQPIGTVVRGPVVLIPGVKGELTIPAALRTGEVANITCDKIEVSATSSEFVPCTPSQTQFCVPQPTWTRSAKASGDIKTGKCEYFVSAPENKPFTVSAGSDFHPAGICGNTLVTTTQNNIVFLANQPMPIVTHNFAATAIQYQHCPH